MDINPLEPNPFDGETNTAALSESLLSGLGQIVSFILWLINSTWGVLLYAIVALAGTGYIVDDLAAEEL
jgi:hypothetical protein